MRPLPFILLALGLLLLGSLMFASCSEAIDRTESESKPPVEWAELRELDDTTHRLTAAAEAENREEIERLLPVWAEQANRVAIQEELPEGIHNAEETDLHQEELASLVSILGDTEEMSDTQLYSLAGGFAPVVHELMKSAGMPHVHGEADDDHDHAEGDDHDHSHDGEGADHSHDHDHGDEDHTH